MDETITKVDLTQDQYTALCKAVEAKGLSRRMSIGKLREDDFLAGAMTVMALLGIKMPVWVLLILTGRKVIMTDLEKVKTTSHEDLPALMGEVKDPEAIALLEKKLKGGSKCRTGVRTS